MSSVREREKILSEHVQCREEERSGGRFLGRQYIGVNVRRRHVVAPPGAGRPGSG